MLILPLIRALIFGNMGFYEWLHGAWFDIATIAAILLLGFWSWYKYIYRISDDGIYIRRGVILVQRRYIAYDKLSVVAVSKPYFLIPFKAVRVSADTDGGAPTAEDFSITMRYDELQTFLDKCKTPFVEQNELKRVYLPRGIYVALLSFVTSNTITGVIFAATFITGSGKVLGNELESLIVKQISRIIRVLAFGIPPIMAVIGAIVLGGWLVSFVLNLVRHLRFSVTRQSDLITIKTGIITVREYQITVHRVNLVELRQTLLTKLFGYYVALLHSNGYGKRKDELSVFMPAGGKKEIEKNLQLLLPEISLNPKKIKPRLKYLSRFLIPPLSWILGISALFVAALWFVDYMRMLVSFIAIMALIPAVWYLFVKIASFVHTGIGESASSYTFYYTYGYRIKAVAVPKEKIVKLRVRRSLFQVMSGCCDVVILTYSEGRKRHVVPNLNYEQVKEMFDIE